MWSVLDRKAAETLSRARWLLTSSRTCRDSDLEVSGEGAPVTELGTHQKNKYIKTRILCLH